MGYIGKTPWCGRAICNATRKQGVSPHAPSWPQLEVVANYHILGPKKPWPRCGKCPCQQSKNVGMIHVEKTYLWFFLSVVIAMLWCYDPSLPMVYNVFWSVKVKGSAFLCKWGFTTHLFTWSIKKKKEILRVPDRAKRVQIQLLWPMVH